MATSRRTFLCATFAERKAILLTRAALFAGTLAAGFLGSTASADELVPRRFVPDEGAQIYCHFRRMDFAGRSEGFRLRAHRKRQHAAVAREATGGSGDHDRS